MKTYLDSNVLIRLITNDLPGLANQAIDFVQNSSEKSIIVLDAVLAEVCFVLEFHDYKMKRIDIKDALLDFLSLSQVKPSADSMAALRLYGIHHKLDYVDCLLLVESAEVKLLTFDKDINRVGQTDLGF